MSLLKKILILLFTIYILGCVEKTTYSGKIITSEDLTNTNITNKDQLIKKFGLPSYIDEIDNKYFYYTEKKTSKNFYNQEIQYSLLFVFQLDKDNKIINTESFDLNKIKNIKFQKKQTPNNVIERGFIESIFGGIGPNPLPWFKKFIVL